MNLPYVSQLEDNGLGYDNCGPAALTAALAALGLTDATRERMHAVAEAARGAAWDLGRYTDFAQLRRAAEAYGAAPAAIRTWDALFAALDAGQPVLLLVDNRFLLPRQYPATAAFNATHFLCLGGYDAAQFAPVCDPLAVYTRGVVAYDGQSVRAGVAAVGGVQALALSAAASAAGTETPAPDPGGVAPAALTDDQRAALALMAELSWGSQSITDAVQRIGALEQQLREAQAAAGDADRLRARLAQIAQLAAT